MNEKVEDLVSSFLKTMEPLCKALGVLTAEEDAKQLAREFVNRFLTNISSQKNCLLTTKDALSATLLRRYNHELVIDFYYLFNPGGEADKIERFFNYEKTAAEEHLQQWSKTSKPDKIKFIPPWIISPQTNSVLYRALSNLAHPNIISMRLNRRGEQYALSVIRDSVLFSVFQASHCFVHRPFLDLIDDSLLDKNTFEENLRDIGKQSIVLLSHS